MDSGLGGTVLDWQLVQPEVAEFGRVCTYNRGGMGWSDPGANRAPAGSSSKSCTLCWITPGSRTYVLVGHSFGGTNVPSEERSVPASAFKAVE